MTFTYPRFFIFSLLILYFFSHSIGNCSNNTTIQTILEKFKENENYSVLNINFPKDNTIYPRNFKSPIFKWAQEKNITSWLLRFSIQNNPEQFFFLAKNHNWLPDREMWEKIKTLAVNKKIHLIVLAYNDIDKNIISKGTVSFTVSSHSISAPIILRDTKLPTAWTLIHPSTIKLRLLDLSSDSSSKIILEKNNACFSCHSFSGHSKNIKLATLFKQHSNPPIVIRTFVTPLKNRNFSVKQSDAIAIIDKKGNKSYINEMSPFQLSYDGKYIISGLDQKSILVMTDNIHQSFTAIFISGTMGIYSFESNTLVRLTHLNENKFINTFPSWSPDGTKILFSRSLRSEYLTKKYSNETVMLKSDLNEFIKDQAYLKFDIYQMSFKNGEAGDPVPLDGASKNNYNNYFPKYSPDGKWIVYNRSKLGSHFIQLDSELYIVSAQGGIARKLNSNFMNHMNSWHSWSPDSRWLIFTSKGNSPYTELFLTHIDENGNDSPPILAYSLAESKSAINIPEFINADMQQIQKINIPQDAHVNAISQPKTEVCLKCHKQP